MQFTRPRVSVQLLPLTTVSTNVIRHVNDHEVPSNFITVSNEFVKTSDGEMFFVENSNS